MNGCSCPLAPNPIPSVNQLNEVEKPRVERPGKRAKGKERASEQEIMRQREREMCKGSVRSVLNNYRVVLCS